MSIRIGLSVLAIASFALALAGCGAAVDARQKELDDLRADVVKLRAEESSLSERIDAVQTQAAKAANGTPAPDYPPQGDARPDLEVVHLAPNAAKNVDPGANAEADGGEAKTIRMVGANLDKNALGDEFSRGMDFYKKRVCDKAIDAFAAYLVKSPDGSSADLATFYRGDCFAQKGEQKKAAEQFSAVVARFPESNKAPDALAKLASAQVKLGDKTASEATLKRLRDEYPMSDAAKKAGSTIGKK